MVANAITFGIYSPMTIVVRCAAPGGGVGTLFRVPSGASLEVATDVFSRAIDAAAEREEPVLVQFE